MTPETDELVEYLNLLLRQRVQLERSLIAAQREIAKLKADAATHNGVPA